MHEMIRIKNRWFKWGWVTDILMSVFHLALLIQNIINIIQKITPFDWTYWWGLFCKLVIRALTTDKASQTKCRFLMAVCQLISYSLGGPLMNILKAILLTCSYQTKYLVPFNTSIWDGLIEPFSSVISACL